MWTHLTLTQNPKRCGSCSNEDSDLNLDRSGVLPKVLISSKQFPGDADMACLRPHFEK